MFSCILANIDDTALSIIDPVTVLIELNSAVKLKNQTVNKGLLGAMQVKPTLEVILNPVAAVLGLCKRDFRNYKDLFPLNLYLGLYCDNLFYLI